jgi:hypothetical protein
VDEQGTRAEDPASGELWLPLAEASPRLGVSVKTLRRRVKAGQIEGRQVSTPHGPAYLVRVGEQAPLGTRASSLNGVGTHRVDGAGSVDDQGTRRLDDVAGLELVRLVAHLQEENRNLAGQLGYIQAQYQQAQEVIRALQAPQGIATDAADSIQEGQQAAPPPEMVPQVSQDIAVPTPRRPWWKFWQ